MNWVQGVFYLFIIAATIQLVAYLLVYSRFIFHKKKEVTQVVDQPVSVVIAARNEEQNLLNNLPLIFKQNHPDFEVIVVNDCSFDDTQDVLRAFEEKYDNLKVVNLKESNTFSGGKKFAVTMGIKAASNEIVVFTDADCKPTSANWLKEMAMQFSGNTEIVLGYGGYEAKNNFVNTLIRFDTISIAIQYLSFAMIGIPYMGVGRNMAYRKSLFFKNKGFAKHQHIKSGDDDLFVNEVGCRANTTVALSNDASTVSKPKITFKEWFHQKRRHLTTGTQYKWQHQLILGSLSMSSIVYLASFVFLLIFQVHPQIVLSVFVLRVLVQVVIYHQSIKKIGEKGLWYLAPILEIVLLLIYPFFVLSNIFIKPPTWKRAI
jgi:glycosyltransferase involved in cell wall biosynthesis